MFSESKKETNAMKWIKVTTITCKLISHDLTYNIYCDPKQKIFSFKLGWNEKNKNSFVFFNKRKAWKTCKCFWSRSKTFLLKKNIFSLIFLFRHQFFLCYKTFDLNTWRNELNLQKQTNITHKIWKDIAFIKKRYCQG